MSEWPVKSCGPSGSQDLALLAEHERRPPPFLALQTATGRNRRQRFWLVFAVSAAIRFATDCHRLQPRGSIKAPSFVVHAGDYTGRVARIGSARGHERKSLGWRLTPSGLDGIEQVGPTDQPDAEHQSPDPEQQVRHSPQLTRPNESGGH